MAQRILPGLIAAGLTAAPLLTAEAAPTPSPSPASPVVAAARFQAFFAAFRKAVLAGDRTAVADMTQFPFKDFRSGHYCEPGQKDCTVSPDSVTSRSRAEFLAHYDRIFTPPVVAGIRANRIRGFRHGSDDGEVAGPIAKDEYLLDTDDVANQLVFVPVGATWKLARIPFYS